MISSLPSTTYRAEEGRRPANRSPPTAEDGPTTLDARPPRTVSRRSAGVTLARQKSLGLRKKTTTATSPQQPHFPTLSPSQYSPSLSSPSHFDDSSALPPSPQPPLPSSLPLDNQQQPTPEITSTPATPTTTSHFPTQSIQSVSSEYSTATTSIYGAIPSPHLPLKQQATRNLHLSRAQTAPQLESHYEENESPSSPSASSSTSRAHISSTETNKDPDGTARAASPPSQDAQRLASPSPSATSSQRMLTPPKSFASLERSMTEPTAKVSVEISPEGRPSVSAYTVDLPVEVLPPVPQLRVSTSVPNYRVMQAASPSPREALGPVHIRPEPKSEPPPLFDLSPPQIPNDTTQSIADSVNSGLTFGSSVERDSIATKSSSIYQPVPLWSPANDDDFEIDDYIGLYAQGFENVASPILTQPMVKPYAMQDGRPRRRTESSARDPYYRGPPPPRGPPMRPPMGPPRGPGSQYRGRYDQRPPRVPRGAPRSSSTGTSRRPSQSSRRPSDPQRRPSKPAKLPRRADSLKKLKQTPTREESLQGPPVRKASLKGTPTRKQSLKKGHAAAEPPEEPIPEIPSPETLQPITFTRKEPWDSPVLGSPTVKSDPSDTNSITKSPETSPAVRQGSFDFPNLNDTNNESLPLNKEPLDSPVTQIPPPLAPILTRKESFKARSDPPPLRSPLLATISGLRKPSVASAPPAQIKYRYSRDRYGFKKESANITLSQYGDWEIQYSDYIERRRSKWVALMESHGLPTENPTRFPPRSDKVRRFIRKGIPPEWRGAAWFWYSDGPSRIEDNPDLYSSLLQDVSQGQLKEADREIIERDLNRTFPDNIKFKPESQSQPDSTRTSVETNQMLANDSETEYIQSLRRVLSAFAVHNPEIGYCQSLNFLAGQLLLFLDNDEEKAFHMLDILTSQYLPGTHSLSLEGANVDIGVMMSALRDSMPALYAKLDDSSDASDRAAQRTSNSMFSSKFGIRGKKTPPQSPGLPTFSLSTTSWFMSCFVGVLPIESCCRVWDVLFYEGAKTLFRVALGIFRVGEPSIMAIRDPMEVFQLVQTLPRSLIDANILMEAAFGEGMEGRGLLSQNTVEKRRSERREANRRDKMKLLSPPPATPGAMEFPRPATAGEVLSDSLSPTMYVGEDRAEQSESEKRSKRGMGRAASIKKLARLKSLKSPKIPTPKSPLPAA